MKQIKNSKRLRIFSQPFAVFYIELVKGILNINYIKQKKYNLKSNMVYFDKYI